MVRTTVRINTHCHYPEDEDRDKAALANVEDMIREFFGDRLLVLFLPVYE